MAPAQLEGVKDAATVVLVRSASAGLETYLLRRHTRSGFMGGAFVFPGGKLDEGDQAEALQSYVSPEVRRACAAALEPTFGKPLSERQAVGLFLAAYRELFEESGVLLGATPGAGGVWRARLNSGQAGMAELLADTGLRPPLAELLYFAHWITPSIEPRRFDTRFFLAAMPPGQEASVDDKEATESRWLSPAAALAAHASGELYLPPPTRAVLTELSAAGDVEQARALCRAKTVRAILPKATALDDELFILLPWDPLYDETEGESLDDPSPWTESGASRIQVR